ncbi:MAG: prepilin-type N-terminal cleavage/methylation domain-containing protein [Patescibacteria group bacterium]|nr:prepilin-type N-terminal cleavage/methylation domain-containing protein [Patescibacteria group bacterium]
MKLRSKKEGFTLIEILIGVSIIAVTMTAMTNLVIVSMRANTFNMNTLQAYYLAEEGLEAMRNMRDSNWMQNYGWNMGEGFECGMEGGSYRFTASKGDPWTLTLNGDPQLYEVDNVSHMSFSHSGGKESAFSRYILVEYEECESGAAKISSVVEWSERGNDQNITLTTYLTDWR